MDVVDVERMFVPQWSPVEVVLRALAVFAFVQIAFRLTGRKQMTSYSPADVTLLFLITVAARESIVGRDPSLTTAFIALATIFGANYALAAVTRRFERVGDVLEGGVLQVVQEGRVDERALKKARLSRDDLVRHLRSDHGTDELAAVRNAFFERSEALTFVLRDAATT